MPSADPDARRARSVPKCPRDDSGRRGFATACVSPTGPAGGPAPVPRALGRPCPSAGAAAEAEAEASDEARLTKERRASWPSSRALPQAIGAVLARLPSWGNALTAPAGASAGDPPTVSTSDGPKPLHGEDVTLS